MTKKLETITEILETRKEEKAGEGTRSKKKREKETR